MAQCHRRLGGAFAPQQNGDTCSNTVRAIIVIALEVYIVDEDEHKLWCDEEVSTSTESKANKDEKAALLQYKISEMDATIKLLMKQITENDAK